MFRDREKGTKLELGNRNSEDIRKAYKRISDKIGIKTPIFARFTQNDEESNRPKVCEYSESNDEVGKNYSSQSVCVGHHKISNNILKSNKVEETKKHDDLSDSVLEPDSISISNDEQESSLLSNDLNGATFSSFSFKQDFDFHATNKFSLENNVSGSR